MYNRAYLASWLWHSAQISKPKFNSKDKLHLKLAELSKNAHALAKRYYEQKDLEAQEELKEVEEGIDKIVTELYGITSEELKEVKKMLRVFRGEEVGELEVQK